ncbi:hypothetical protein [Salibaculum sp.]|uniref:hypothetical protein n=1 Tax=Salibaculum sp. TaxID=2855480 RepID=UPI002B499F9B|nr:hypothetical protein [Salibaculum sp.]HKL68302.1 hypothetical protein [Salibaculum sp.]
MTHDARSTIAALCFAKPTKIDFQSLKRELGVAFTASHGATHRITAEYDDFVIYDLEGGRVCLGYADFTEDLSDALGAPGLPAEGLIVSVGTGPATPASGPFYSNREDLCRGLAREIDRAAPADHLMVFDREEMITGDIYDELVDMVRRLARQDAAQKMGPEDADEAERVSPILPERPVASGKTHSRPQPPRPPRPTHAAQAADRAGAEAVARADATQRAEAAALREALHAAEDEEAELERKMAQRLTRRLAIYTMNGSAIMLSAPLGMAALTYCVLGREDARIPARALGLAGAAMGLMHAGVGTPILSYLV